MEQYLTYVIPHSPNVSQIVNLQNRQDKAVPYQVHQFLIIIEEYALNLEDDA
ncbi:MAG: hypothetical protein GDA44_06355 [Prochloron sp. SP5CPC1]|nr:hypothetical protein [Candidatus Paraprochloron terpiosi SP5CPC1]